MPIHPPSHSRCLPDGLRGGSDADVGHRIKHPRSSVAVPGTEITEPFEIRFEEKIIRILECVDGSVEVDVVCSPRFDYGTVRPRIVLDETPTHGLAHGGANALLVYCSCPMRVEDQDFRSSGTLSKGEKAYTGVVSLTHYTTSFSALDSEIDPAAIEDLRRKTIDHWEGWSGQCAETMRARNVGGEYADEVLRSVLALKALVYEPSGAILAAATTSLPEDLGGERNWDYRFTWIRDASFSLKALLAMGLTSEARGFKGWLEWTTAYPEDLQLMYGIRGERQLQERILPLEGYSWLESGTRRQRGGGAVPARYLR